MPVQIVDAEIAQIPYICVNLIDNAGLVYLHVLRTSVCSYDARGDNGFFATRL